MKPPGIGATPQTIPVFVCTYLLSVSARYRGKSFNCHATRRRTTCRMTHDIPGPTRNYQGELSGCDSLNCLSLLGPRASYIPPTQLSCTHSPRASTAYALYRSCIVLFDSSRYLEAPLCSSLQTIPPSQMRTSTTTTGTR